MVTDGRLGLFSLAFSGFGLFLLLRTGVVGADPRLVSKGIVTGCPIKGEGTTGLGVIMPALGCLEASAEGFSGVGGGTMGTVSFEHHRLAVMP